MMIKERLNNLRPYVRGVRFFKDMAIVDVIFKDGWNVYESNEVSYKVSKTDKNYYMIFPKEEDSSDFDMLLDHIEDIIKNNIERENKLILLKTKIEELKVLFDTKSLNELECLEFKIGIDEEMTLNNEDLSDIKTKNHNGIELPPTSTKETEEEVIEKEEV